jgi:hypothetical protein
MMRWNARAGIAEPGKVLAVPVVAVRIVVVGIVVPQTV